MNKKDRGKLREILLENQFNITVDHSDFLQVTIVSGEEKSFVDFYLYEIDLPNGILSEKWNFLGRPDQKEYTIFVPLDYIFPLSSEDYHGAKVPMPSDPESCCRFLYGEGWKKPRLKGFGYKLEIVDHRPQIRVKENDVASLLTAYLNSRDEIERYKDLLEVSEKFIDLMMDTAEVRGSVALKREISKLLLSLGFKDAGESLWNSAKNFQETKQAYLEALNEAKKHFAQNNDIQGS